MTLEAAVVTRIQKWLKHERIWFVNVHGNRQTRAGTPDILACVNSFFLAIEAKRPGGETSKIQEFQHDLIVHNRGRVLVTPSLEEVQVAVKELRSLISMPKSVWDLWSVSSELDPLQRHIDGEKNAE